MNGFVQFQAEMLARTQSAGAVDQSLSQSRVDAPGAIPASASQRRDMDPGGKAGMVQVGRNGAQSGS